MRCHWEPFGAKVRCRRCRVVYRRPARRPCSLRVRSGPTCPFAAIVLALKTPAAFARLERCRQCTGRQLQIVRGTAKCLARDPRGLGPCTGVRHWAEFLAGEEECDFWG